MTSDTCKHKDFYTDVNWRDLKPSFDSDKIKYVLHHLPYTLRSGNNFISIEWYTYQFDNFDLFKSIFDNYKTRQFCYFCDKDQKRGLDCVR